MAARHALMEILPEQRRVSMRAADREAESRANETQISPVASVPEVADSRAYAERATWNIGMSGKLHDEIFEKLSEDFIRRMKNWVRSRDGSAVATSRFDERVDNCREEHPIPTLMGEAQDTDRAMHRLPQRYQEVVTVFWMYNARPLRWMATATPRLRLWKLGAASFEDWLSKAHMQLQAEIIKLSGESARRRETAESSLR